MIITSLRLKNFKMFRDIHIRDVPSFMVLVGANGTGKTTFFDALRFLRDCVLLDVQTACNVRGGIKQIVNRGTPNEPIEIEIAFNMDINGKSESCTYQLSVQAESGGTPQAISEKFFRLSKCQNLCFETSTSEKGSYIHAFSLHLYLTPKLVQGMKRSFGDKVSFISDILAAKFWGQVDNTIAKLFCSELDRWHFSNLQLPYTRQISEDLSEVRHLPGTGKNIALYAHYLMKRYPDTYESVIEKMRKCIPSLGSIKPIVMEDNRVTLRFTDRPYRKGFIRPMCRMAQSRCLAICCYSMTQSHIVCCVLRSQKSHFSFIDEDPCA